MFKDGAGEISQWLGPFATLSGDLGLIPVPMWWLTTIHNSTFKGSDALF